VARERMLPARLIRPLRFAIVGVSNTLIDVGVFSLLAIGLSVLPAAANVVSYAVGTANSWVLNRCWTFRDLTGSGSGAQFAGFAAINLAILGLSTAGKAHRGAHLLRGELHPLPHPSVSGDGVR
jgi:putative flippase GtrA